MTTPTPTTEGAWLYRADRPQRYSGKYSAYRAQGGTVVLEEQIQGFIAHGVNRNDMARFYFFCLMQDQLKKEGIVGDVAELGVYRGNTATILARIARSLHTTAYFLDTFEGFAKADLKGVDSGSKAGEFSDTSLESVRELVGEENTCFIKGYFPETATSIPVDAYFCVVHIDCDLYYPIKSALEFFYPRLVPGGYLVVHDYSSLHWKGAEKAVDEFFSDKVEPVIPLPDSSGSVVIRKARSYKLAANWLDQKRFKLITENWVDARNNGIGELLGEGWGGPEAWGLWGIGEKHELHFVFGPSTRAEIVIEAETQAALVGSRTTQSVEVSQAGKHLTTWDFSISENRAVRAIKIPLSPQAGPDGFRHISLEFRPQSCTPPSELASDLSEKRLLGLGLVRIRRSSI